MQLEEEEISAIDLDFANFIKNYPDQETILLSIAEQVLAAYCPEIRDFSRINDANWLTEVYQHYGLQPIEVRLKTLILYLICIFLKHLAKAATMWELLPQPNVYELSPIEKIECWLTQKAPGYRIMQLDELLQGNVNSLVAKTYFDLKNFYEHIILKFWQQLSDHYQHHTGTQQEQFNYLQAAFLALIKSNYPTPIYNLLAPKLLSIALQGDMAEAVDPILQPTHQLLKHRIWAKFLQKFPQLREVTHFNNYSEEMKKVFIQTLRACIDETIIFDFPYKNNELSELEQKLQVAIDQKHKRTQNGHTCFFFHQTTSSVYEAERLEATRITQAALEKSEALQKAFH